MKSKFVGLLIVAALFQTLPLGVASAAKNGGPCKRVGLLEVTKQVLLVCTKSGSKLVWKVAVLSDRGQKRTTTTSTSTTSTTILPPSRCGNSAVGYAAGFGNSGGVLNFSEKALSLDGAGNVYVAAGFTGAIDIDVGPGVSYLNGSQGSMLLMKLDPAGSLIWAKQFGEAGNSSTGYWGLSPSIAVDSNGHIYTTGSFFNSGDFDPGIKNSTLVPKGKRDSWLSKFDASGNLLWVKQFSGSDYFSVDTLAIDTGGNIVVAGFFNLVADFDPGPATFNVTAQGTPGDGVTSGRYGDDAFVLKLDGSGNFLWAKSFGGSYRDYIRSIVTDSAGEIVAIGTFATELGSGTIMRLDSSGNLKWTKSLPNPESLAVSRTGSLNIAGWFTRTADLDPGSEVLNFSSRGSDSYIVKLDSSANFVWAKVIGSPTIDWSPSISLDSADNIYSFGRFAETIDFDPGDGISNRTSPGGDRSDLADIYSLRLGPSGEFVWVKQFNAVSLQISGANIADSAGNTVSVSAIVGSADMDFGQAICTLGSSSPVSILVVKLNSSGSNS